MSGNGAGHGMRVSEWVSMTTEEKNARLEAARPFVGKMSWHAMSFQCHAPVDALRRYHDPAWHKQRLRQSRLYREKNSVAQNYRETVTSAGRVHPGDIAARLAEIPPDTRDLTAYLFGDPLPGRRAIDRVKPQASYPPRPVDERGFSSPPGW